MVHKCPVCRHQPIIGWRENQLYCPECGWRSETTKIVIQQIV